MILENISMLCKKNGISIAKLERETGLGNATVRGWKRSSPTVDKLKLVADYFNCTVDALLCNDTAGADHNKKLKGDYISEPRP